MAVDCRPKEHPERHPQARPLHRRGHGGGPGSPVNGRTQPMPFPAGFGSPAPTGPALRAIPCPEVTEPACRLPLPTLIYQLEAVHLGDLLRISVRPGVKIQPFPQDFQGPTTAHRTPQEARCFTRQHPFLPTSGFQGVRLLQRKENSSQGCRQRLLVRFYC